MNGFKSYHYKVGDYDNYNDDGYDDVFQHQGDVQQKGAKVQIGSPSQRNPAGRNEQRPLDQCK